LASAGRFESEPRQCCSRRHRTKGFIDRSLARNRAETGGFYRQDVPQLVRLRVELADSPGSLAVVAAVIAKQGGNITAIDVHRSRPETAVDEIVVEFPDDVDLNGVRAALADSGGGTLLSHQSAKRADPVVQTLRRAVELSQSSSLSPDDELAAAVAELCSSPAVWVSGGDEARTYDAGRFALERHGAVAVRSGQVPPGLQATLPDGDVWLLAVPDLDLGERDRVVFIARPLDLKFTATEIARVEALMALYDELVRLRGFDRSPVGPN
jgi:hypothetical protein